MVPLRRSAVNAVRHAVTPALSSRRQFAVVRRAQIVCLVTSFVGAELGVGMIIVGVLRRLIVIGVAGVTRRLRRLGGGRAKIVHLADDVAETFDALLADRLRTCAKKLLARARPLAAAGRVGCGLFARRPRRNGFVPGRLGAGLRAGGAARGWRNSVRELRAASASTLRIASSSDRRSRVMSDSDSGGSTARNCVTSAVRARSYSARRTSPVFRSSPSTAREISGW